MNSEWCTGIDNAKRRSETDKRWYYVPPYNNEGEIVVNADGERVAVFEMKEDALSAVNDHNKNIEQ